MPDNYTDSNAYQQAKDAAQNVANASGKKMVLGYSNYAGWCHVDITDTNAVAELGDVALVEPSSKMGNPVRAL